MDDRESWDREQLAFRQLYIAIGVSLGLILLAELVAIFVR